MFSGECRGSGKPVFSSEPKLVQKRTPRIRTLEDMRELEMRQRAGREQQDAPQGEIELNLLIHQLKFLKETNPPKFEAAKQVVAALPQSSSQSLKAAAT